MQPPSRPAETSPPDWERIYDAHAAGLLVYARQWLGDRASAEDAVQGAFVKVWRSSESRGGSGRDIPLLFAAVRSEALDLLKTSSRRRLREERAAVDDAWWEDDPLVGREREIAVRAALDELPAEEREVVVLRVWAGLTFSQIAATLDANENTVTARCRRGLKSLERLLPEECREPLS